MGTGWHNRRCENALKDGCVCTGCGGSMHGWQGSMDLAGGPPDARQRRRDESERKLKREAGSSRLKNTQETRSAVTDLARLDVVDWLANPASRAAPDRTQRAPELRLANAGQDGHQRHLGGQVTPAEQVTAVAEALMAGTWPEITRGLDRLSPRPKDVRRELASHVWCDLLVGMIRVIETVRQPLRALAGMPPALIKAAVLDSAMQQARPHVTEAVVGLVVSEVWRAFTTAAVGGVPLLELITNEEALRALQILAVFVCPAPSRHPEVRRHALKPLGEEVHHILTEQTEARLTELFSEWLPTEAAPDGLPEEGLQRSADR